MQVALIPVAKLFGSLGLFETTPGVVLFHAAFGLPFAIFLLRNFFAEIPRELLEAARLDGAGEVRLFTRVVLPLGGPAIASLGIFQFLWVWNDMLVALIFADAEQPADHGGAAAAGAAVRQQHRRAGAGRLRVDGHPAGRLLRLPAAVRVGRDGGRGEVRQLSSTTTEQGTTRGQPPSPVPGAQRPGQLAGHHGRQHLTGEAPGQRSFPAPRASPRAVPPPTPGSGPGFLMPGDGQPRAASALRAPTSSSRCPATSCHCSQQLPRSRSSACSSSCTAAESPQVP